MKPTEMEEMIAKIRVQSWDQSIGLDGAIAVLNGLRAAGYKVVPLDETEAMLQRVKAISA